MGLFSGKKKTYVSSSVWNLAGDEAERPDYLKGLITGNVISNTDASFSDVLQGGYINGPGIKLRNFYRWANIPDNYDEIGIPGSSLIGSFNLDIEILAEQITHDPDDEVVIQNAEAGLCDFDFWAEQWMLANEPTLIDSNWTCDFDSDTNEIVIKMEDLTEVRFTPTNFQQTGLYIYTTYILKKGVEYGPIDPGTDTIIDPSDPYPSTVGWTQITNIDGTGHVDLDTTVDVLITYSDGRPDETSENTTTETYDYPTHVGHFTKTEYQGEASGSTDATESIKYDQYEGLDGYVSVEVTETTEDEDIGGGVIKTTKTTTSTQVWIQEKLYRISTQEISNSSWGPLTIDIYRIGSGNIVLDNMINQTSGTGEYFPFIPVRLDNKFIDETPYTEASDQAFKAYKKLTGKPMDKLIDQVKDNENLEDIDFTYVTFGVSLNVKENACRKYLWAYFNKLKDNQYTTEADYNLWDAAMDNYVIAQDNWAAWKAAQSDPGDPLYGTVEPVVPEYPTTPNNNVFIKSQGSFNNNYDIRLAWKDIREDSGTGLKKPGAKKGDLWFEYLGDANKIYSGYTKKTFFDISDEADVVALHYQETDNSWKSLILIGFYHANYIYNGKFVRITAKEALEDSEESGFVIPLHYPTFKEMSLVDSTQMSTACIFLLFNCYKVVKQKWYQTGFFKIIVIVAIIAISVVTGGTGAFSIGLLGTNAAVGAALGLTGIAAIIAGAVVNAIVATILLTAINELATFAFGDKLGAILGTIIGIATMNVAMNFSATGNLALNFGNLMQADKLLMLGSSVAGGFVEYLKASAMEYGQKTQDLIEEYEKNSKEISELYEKNIGYGMGQIDPLLLVDTFRFAFEPRDSFLGRTLMTGSDVAEMSLSMLTNYARITLANDLPL